MYNRNSIYLCKNGQRTNKDQIMVAPPPLQWTMIGRKKGRKNEEGGRRRDDVCLLRGEWVTAAKSEYEMQCRFLLDVVV
jgi:hypothetical protein